MLAAIIERTDQYKCPNSARLQKDPGKFTESNSRPYRIGAKKKKI